MPLTTEYTTFTRDVLGRYVCNTFDEAIVTVDANARAAAGLPQRGDLRSFDFIIKGQSGHAGFFPFNKFSTVPLLIKAAREAANQSGFDRERAARATLLRQRRKDRQESHSALAFER